MKAKFENSWARHYYCLNCTEIIACLLVLLSLERCPVINFIAVFSLKTDSLFYNFNSTDARYPTITPSDGTSGLTKRQEKCCVGFVTNAQQLLPCYVM